ncbi:hypothetical protein L6164_034577 [Bauhinia variegata]|uniref:Uncharacterized protein n=1 Tax=Bauhinia variegata TaxID=167791 RepID=A0ACB9KVN1_BAUVA|nr:hypothetical protein L6164_034577 [Bauhinia variegata]
MLYSVSTFGITFDRCGACRVKLSYEGSEHEFQSTEQMAASVFSVRSSTSKLRSWGRCSKHVRQQRTRLYIIWRCTVLLLCWHD